jgi:membrane protease YdiL (CAAX protease family)
VNTANEVDLVPKDDIAPVTYHPTPDNPPWNSLVAIGVWLISIALVVFVPLIFTAPYILKEGLDFSDKSRLREFMLTDPTAVILQLAPLVLAHAFTLLLAWFVVTKFNTFSFRQTLGWSMNGFRIWHAALITIAFYAIAVILTTAFGDVENEFDLMLKSSRYAVYLIVFFATFTAPLVEEVVYRGLLYSSFQRKFGMVLAVILVTLLFTAVHVPQYSLGTNPDYAAVVALLLLSLTLTLIRARTGSLLPCIVLHTIFNGTQSLLLIIEPYLKSEAPTVDPTTFIFFK